MNWDLIWEQEFNINILLKACIHDIVIIVDQSNIINVLEYECRIVNVKKNNKGQRKKKKSESIGDWWLVV